MVVGVKMYIYQAFFLTYTMFEKVTAVKGLATRLHYRQVRRTYDD